MKREAETLKTTPRELAEDLVDVVPHPSHADIDERFFVQFGFCGMPFRALVALRREVAEKIAEELKTRLGDHFTFELLKDDR